MTNFEVDFLQDQTTWFEPFVTELDGSARWLGGMARAAASLNMSVQYCMSHPAAFLEALSFPAVTNGRASGDYQSRGTHDPRPLICRVTLVGTAIDTVDPKNLNPKALTP